MSFSKKAIKEFIFLTRIKLTRKVAIGSGEVIQKGWFSTDIDSLNLTNEKDFYKYWKPNTLKGFFAEHVWEHLTLKEGIEASQNCYKFLRKGGFLRIAVPDGLHPDREYIDCVKPCGTGNGSDDHKVLYTYKSLGAVLKKAGFRIEFLEYWDENKKFHFKKWDINKGLVRRSMFYDWRNSEGQLKYTSIIIDAIKD